MPLVINSLGGRHTNTHMHTHTDVHTETISRNQARAGRIQFYLTPVKKLLAVNYSLKSF